MLNFASLFNQWRSQNNNGVLDLLAQPNVTMGRLLDEQSFQGEYKSGNTKVAEFMRYDRYQELIDFVTIVGPPEDKKRSYKYPLSACEILSLENTVALDFFLPEKPLIIENKITETVQVETEVEVEVQESSSEKKEQTEAATQETKPKETIAAEPKPIEEPQVQLLKEETEQQGQKKTTESIVPEAKAVEKQEADKMEAEKSEQQAKKQAEQASPQKAEANLQLQTPKKKTKKVTRKENMVVEKVEEKEMPALILKLLSYFDEEVNYTLAGYVCKILGSLLVKRPAELMKYILQESMMHKIINHAQSRSVGEIISKILTHETTLFLDLRREFFKELLTRTSTFSEISVISNLSSYICQIIEKVATNLKSNTKIIEFNNVFFSLETITQVIKNVMSDEENVAVYNAPILLTYLTNVPFVLPDDENVVKQFMSLGQLFIQKSCEKLQVERRNREKLGFGRIKILQILKFVIKENVLNSKAIVAKTKNFFSILLNLVKQYGMNNVLHNEVVKILEIALSEPANSPLNDAVLRDDVLLNFISEEVEEDKKIKAGDSIYSARKGYIAHVTNLCVRIRELSETNANIKQLSESAIFTSVYQSFVQKQVFNSRKSLAGLMMKKEQKHDIMFQRQDIIASHLTFLQKCPSSIFQPEPATDQVNIQHPDLVSELQKQLEENLAPKSLSEEEKEKSPAESQKEPQKAQQEVEGQGRYWAMHLEYNIDDLIADL